MANASDIIAGQLEQQATDRANFTDYQSKINFSGAENQREYDEGKLKSLMDFSSTLSGHLVHRETERIKKEIDESTALAREQEIEKGEEAIEAEINATVNELAKIVRCNCSICKRKNATMGMVKNVDFKVTKGQDKLKLYQYHTKVANHYFCTECGIYTHHNPRSAPAMTGFNLGCVDEVKVEDLKEVANFDGLNHPMDQEK